MREKSLLRFRSQWPWPLTFWRQRSRSIKGG